MSCISEIRALVMQIDCICRACLVFNAEVGSLIKCIDHDVSEVVCSRYVKLHPKLFVVYNAKRRLVEPCIDMIKLEMSNCNRLTKVIHSIHNLVDIKDSPCRKQLIICLHDGLCWNADEYVLFVRKGREIGMQGKAKRKYMRTLIMYLIGNA